MAQYEIESNKSFSRWYIMERLSYWLFWGSWHIMSTGIDTYAEYWTKEEAEIAYENYFKKKYSQF